MSFRRPAQLVFEAARLAPNASFLGGHNCWHLILVTGGDCQEDAGRIHDLTPGSVRLSSPGERHRLSIGGDGLACRIFFLPDRWVSDATPRGNVFLRDERLSELLGHEGAASQAPASCLRRDLDVRESLARVTAAANNREPGPAPSWIEDAGFTLRAGKHQVDRIARSAKVSREHFARTFARYYGCSPAAYRGAHKLMGAVDLLCGSDMPIADVAHVAGFTDQSHLTRAVSLRFGLSPARLRGQR
jgi:AraC-like DNA-binding protein